MKTFNQFSEDIEKRTVQFTEQTPTMSPNPYNVMIAKQQAARKRAREVHAQQEIGSEARSQELAKQRRMKAIMSRE